MHWTSPLGKLPILWSFRHVCCWAASFFRPGNSASLPVLCGSLGCYESVNQVFGSILKEHVPPRIHQLIDELCQIHTIRACSFWTHLLFLEASASSQQCPFRSHSPVLITSDYTKSSVRFGNPINMSPQHCYSGSDMF